MKTRKRVSRSPIKYANSRALWPHYKWIENILNFRKKYKLWMGLCLFQSGFALVKWWILNIWLIQIQMAFCECRSPFETTALRYICNEFFQQKMYPTGKMSFESSFIVHAIMNSLWCFYDVIYCRCWRPFKKNRFFLLFYLLWNYFAICSAGAIE